ncbi:MAG TPA: outer membrane beta-barrel protein, partial [Flavisolibacter sp.]|nr:outer membrane beta-barrel protein [Flavisolibacter sp.]
MTNVYYNVAGVDQPTEAKYGFVGGLGLTYFIESSLYFTPSLYYSRRGYKVTYTQRADPPDPAALNNNTTINTICFSPQLQWNFSQGSKYVFVRLGPTLDVAINGREEFDSSGGKHVERDMLFSSVGYSLITSSANLQVGFEQKK